MSPSLLVLGPFELLWHDQPLTFSTNPTRALLAYLAVEADRAHSREQLAALLWQDQPKATAYTNLRQTLARIRKAFPSESALADCLTITPQTVQFNSAAISSDAVHFEALQAECAAHAHSDLATCGSCRDRLQQAAQLYRGEFLHGLFLPDSRPFEEWLLLKRETLHRHALDVLHTLTHAFESAGDYKQMRHYAARQLAIEPWREDAHMQLMRAFAYSGQRTVALAQYETACRVLREELGIEPGIEMRALYERIQADELSPVKLNVAPVAHNLPAQLTPFVGREGELVEITARLQQPDVRLLTLIGAGGMGKTRLALEVARSHLVAFPDGVFFVSLAPLTIASMIPIAIATALKLNVRDDPQHAVLQAIQNKHLLLILDNVEHVLDGIGIVVDLLQAAPQVQLLATSREQLNVRGEHLFWVPPMEYELDAARTNAATSAAGRLFAQTVRRVQTSFEVNATNTQEVQRICRLVQGIPLGLELAAAWTETLSLSEIAAEIERSADFLATEWRDAPPRQRSMRAVFDWSWALLNDAERQALSRISVFRGGFTREAAQEVAGVSLRVLTRLVQKSLLSRGPATDSAGMYEIHELLRQFASEQLDAQRATGLTHDAHARYYLGLVGGQEWALGQQPLATARQLRAALDNIREAWRWAAKQGMWELIGEHCFGLNRLFQISGLLYESTTLFGLTANQLEADIRRANDSRVVRLHGLKSRFLSLQVVQLQQQSRFSDAMGMAQSAIMHAEQSNDDLAGALAYFAWASMSRSANTALPSEQYHAACTACYRAIAMAHRYAWNTD